MPVKSVAQQTLAALHRFRSAWLASRTARINTLRGLLREFGITIPLGARHVLPHVQSLLEDADSALPGALKPTLAEGCTEIREFEARTHAVEHQLAVLARQTPVVARLLTIPGIGLLTTTALVAFVGEVRRFPSGRHFACFLGLTPREHSSGRTRRLGAISKHVNAYLRMLLIHGARGVLAQAGTAHSHDRLRAWALDVQRRRGHNKATVALANKLARLAWTVWRNDTDFREVPMT